MNKYVWLVILAIPPWIAAEFGAPKLVLLLAATPFFFRAATLGEDPEKHLLGEGFAKFRTPTLAALLAGGVVLGIVFLVMFRVASGRW